MKYSKDVGINWHLRFRLIIQELKEELELTEHTHRELREYKTKRQDTYREISE